MYVITAGTYEDERIIGLNSDLEAAKKTAQDCLSYLVRDATVYGPFEDGAVFTDSLRLPVVYVVEYTR